MRLGNKGWAIVQSLDIDVYSHSGLLSEWQQQFFQSFWEKAQEWEDECFISEKQLAQLNKIQELMGGEPLLEEDLSADNN